MYVKEKRTEPDFYIEQFFIGCLAEFSYYIESDGEAAIIDPLRETDQYVSLAKERNAKVKYVCETHIHADFVSGHCELAQRTGATIVFGPGAVTGFDCKVATDGEVLQIGTKGVGLRVDHTPGHTLESVCFVLMAGGKEFCSFTGDTLFLGEVGRPDLAVKGDITKETLAGMLYDSLRNKVMTLPDDCIVYPGHGAGSACGKKIGTGSSCTIGI
jgi:glyoxylase-like metal-dependent hydrolase (beta-lactamase superfamily II)